MNPWRWVDPRVRSVRLDDVRRYFLDKGWTFRPGKKPNPNLLRFVAPAEMGGPRLYQMFPSSDESDDFPQRVAELITTLSELEARHPVAVLDDMLRGDPDRAAGNGAARAAVPSERK